MDSYVILNMATQAVKNWKMIVIFPVVVGLILVLLLVAFATANKSIIETSLDMNVKPIFLRITPFITRMEYIDSIVILSAVGSRTLPILELIFNLRAIKPSKTSDTPDMRKINNARNHSPKYIKYITNNESMILRKDRMFGIVKTLLLFI